MTHYTLLFFYRNVLPGRSMKIFVIEFKKIVQKLRIFQIAELKCKLINIFRYKKIL